MKPQILILHASVGSGHARAAEALQLAAQQTLPEAQIRCEDTLDFATRLFRRFYRKSYLDLVNKAPHVLGFIYDWLDRPRGTSGTQGRSDGIRQAFQRMNLRSFLKLIQNEHWDLVLNTHFLPAEIIAALRVKGKLNIPQVTITTDFDAHRMWVNQSCDHFYTPTEEGARSLEYWGIPPSNVSVTGIPIHPVFSEEKSKSNLLTKYGLDAERPIVLQMAGGFGVGPVEHVYRSLLNSTIPIQVVVIAGRNEKVQNRLQRIDVPQQHATKIVGFTREIDELMRLADLVVTKPGGLTTSEVLACGAAMVIFNPTPGQEWRNSDFLLENGSAIKVNGLPALTWKVESLLADKERLQRIKNNAANLGRKDAAFTVLNHALQFIPQQEQIVKSAPDERESAESR